MPDTHKMEIRKKRLSRLLTLLSSQLLILILIAAAVAVAGFLFGWDLERLLEPVRFYPILAPIVYVGVVALSVIVAPLGALPLMPLAASLWGVLLGGALSALGWWIGALVAFSLARFVGRPILERIVSLEQLERWSKRLPRDVTFFSVVAVHLVLPVELPSYGFGFLKYVPFRIYAPASLIGVTPFSFVLVALGGSLAQGEWLFFVLGALLFACLVILLYRLWQMYYNTV